ncbi:DUF1793-domain-containing protein [Mycena alexandri]|uniref:DUF1793-domain-containing protein n=1 Tax=Mycena alexandri TaxID=1745969 RepID=A0AAD6X6M1_9AGAR|nr:DUF1793-domain-containing protein [Mycena alexandri]KAJ7037415.1 DUF1793-domain-containing protein [Mycena alexandri]
MRSQIFCAALYAVQALAAPSWTSTPFNPPSIPLAVRSPYLNTWLPQGGGNALNDEWPTLWQGSVTGWVGFAKVDGTSYSFLGSASVDGVSFTKATQKSFTFTTTQSIFVLSAGPVDITVTFLSPVETDLVKLSIPFSYMDVSVASTDGATHSVQIYSDISGEWSSGALEWDLEWTTTTTNVVSHALTLVNPAQWEEVNDHIQYGAVYYSALNGKGVTYQTGRDVVVRAQFLNNGTLTNAKDTFFRAISYSWPVFAISKDLGKVGTSPASFLYTIGNVRDPAIKYILAGGATQSRSLYFWSKFSSIPQLVSFFLNDYSNALKTANALDQKVEADANKISPDYAGIVALSIRQSLAANELTISKNAQGGWNTSDVLYFMKEISSDGNINTVDVMFPAFPVFLYLLPELGQYLMEPLYRYQVSGQYPNKWAVHDMGPHFPKATGHNDGQDEAMPVEESGNMLIMALSYARATNDHSQITRYANLLDQWTQFLIEDSLIPANQLSTDDFAGQLANQTNLAIKGITGIRCMGEIWGLLGNKDKQANYTSIAASYVQQWLNFSASTTGPHLTLSYGDSASWGLAYNLFGDVHLKLNLFPKSVYDEQTAWYKTVANKYGVPLDTRHTYTKSDWEIWTSAIVTDTTLRDLFITGVKDYVSNGLNNAPFGDWYDTITGVAEGFKARPVVGGHLALLVV